MDYVVFGRTGVRVSPLCLGCWNFGWVTDEESGIRMTHAAIDRGINILDTANVYSNGKSEEIVGKALDGGRRANVFLATKVRTPMGNGPLEGGASRRHIMEQVEGSLRRLRSDWIDLYQIHWPDPDTPLDETLRALDDLVRMGKVRYIGTSNHPAWKLAESMGIAEKYGIARFVSEQPPYSILRRPAEREVLPFAEKHGVAIIPYSPLAGGWLSGKYRKGRVAASEGRMGRNPEELKSPAAQARLDLVEMLIAVAEEKGTTLSRFALAWVGSHPAVTAPIIGPRTMEQFEDNLAALDVAITDEDRKRVDAIVPAGIEV